MSYITPPILGAGKYVYTIPVLYEDNYITYSTEITKISDSYLLVNIVNTKVFLQMIKLRNEMEHLERYKTEYNCTFLDSNKKIITVG